MSRKIMCAYFKKELDGLDFALYPGEIGKKIFNEISKDAWQLWIKKQTMLVNEKQLNMMNPEDRKFLEEKMVEFLFEGVDVKIDGYVPVEK